MRKVIRFILIPYLLLVVLRLWLAWPVDVPMTSDELKYLGHARYLATGSAGVGLKTLTLDRVGYPLLIAPAFLLGNDPAAAFKRAQALNALLMSLIYPLAFHLAGRLRDISPADRMLIAFCVNLYPAAMLYCTTAMSASAFMPAFFLVTATAAAALVRPSWWRWLACFAAAAGLAMIHERAIVVVGAVLATWVCSLLLVNRRRPNRRKLGVYLVGTAAVLAAALVSWIIRSGLATDERLWSHLTTLLKGLGRPAAIAVTFSGQLWYLGLSTCGILFAGLLFGWLSGRGRWRVPSLFWLMLFGSAAGVFAVSVGFLAPSWERFTYWIHGRYNEGVLLPVLVVALVALENTAERGNRRQLVASVAGALSLIGVLAGVLVQFWTPHAGAPGSLSASAISIHSQLFGWGILRASASAFAGLLVVGFLFAVRWRLGIVSLGIFFAVSTLATYRGSWIGRNHEIAGQQELIRRIESLEPKPETILVASQSQRSYFEVLNVQYFLPELDYQHLPPPAKSRQSSGELVLSDRLDLQRWYPGARLVGLENLPFRRVRHIQSLWVLPGPLQEDLAARRWLFPRNFPGRLDDDVLAAAVRLVEPAAAPSRLRSGEELEIEVEVVHRGSAPWPHRAGLPSREYAVGLLAQWFTDDADTPVAQVWTHLPRTLYPGESVRQVLPLRSSAAAQALAAGDYRVSIAIAQVFERKPRTSEHGTLEIEIEVVP